MAILLGGIDCLGRLKIQGNLLGGAVSKRGPNKG